MSYLTEEEAQIEASQKMEVALESEETESLTNPDSILYPAAPISEPETSGVVNRPQKEKPKKKKLLKTISNVYEDFQKTNEELDSLNKNLFSVINKMIDTQKVIANRELSVQDSNANSSGKTLELSLPLPVDNSESKYSDKSIRKDFKYFRPFIDNISSPAPANSSVSQFGENLDDTYKEFSNALYSEGIDIGIKTCAADNVGDSDEGDDREDNSMDAYEMEAQPKLEFSYPTRNISDYGESASQDIRFMNQFAVTETPMQYEPPMQYVERVTEAVRKDPTVPARNIGNFERPVHNIGIFERRNSKMEENLVLKEPDECRIIVPVHSTQSNKIIPTHHGQEVRMVYIRDNPYILPSTDNLTSESNIARENSVGRKITYPSTEADGSGTAYSTLTSMSISDRIAQQQQEYYRTHRPHVSDTRQLLDCAVQQLYYDRVATGIEHTCDASASSEPYQKHPSETVKNVDEVKPSKDTMKHDDKSLDTVSQDSVSENIIKRYDEYKRNIDPDIRRRSADEGDQEKVNEVTVEKTSDGQKSVCRAKLTYGEYKRLAGNTSKSSSLVSHHPKESECSGAKSSESGRHFQIRNEEPARSSTEKTGSDRRNRFSVRGNVLERNPSATNTSNLEEDKEPPGRNSENSARGRNSENSARVGDRRSTVPKREAKEITNEKKSESCTNLEPKKPDDKYQRDSKRGRSGYEVSRFDRRKDKSDYSGDRWAQVTSHQPGRSQNREQVKREASSNPFDPFCPSDSAEKPPKVTTVKERDPALTLCEILKSREVTKETHIKGKKRILTKASATSTQGPSDKIQKKPKKEISCKRDKFNVISEAVVSSTNDMIDSVDVCKDVDSSCKVVEPLKLNLKDEDTLAEERDREEQTSLKVHNEEKEVKSRVTNDEIPKDSTSKVESRKPSTDKDEFGIDESVKELEGVIKESVSEKLNYSKKEAVGSKETFSNDNSSSSQKEVSLENTEVLKSEILLPSVFLEKRICKVTLVDVFWKAKRDGKMKQKHLEHYIRKALRKDRRLRKHKLPEVNKGRAVVKEGIDIHHGIQESISDDQKEPDMPFEKSIVVKPKRKRILSSDSDNDESNKTELPAEDCDGTLNKPAPGNLFKIPDAPFSDTAIESRADAVQTSVSEIISETNKEIASGNVEDDFVITAAQKFTQQKDPDVVNKDIPENTSALFPTRMEDSSKRRSDENITKENTVATSHAEVDNNTVDTSECRVGVLQQTGDNSVKALGEPDEKPEIEGEPKLGLISKEIACDVTLSTDEVKDKDIISEAPTTSEDCLKTNVISEQQVGLLCDGNEGVSTPTIGIIRSVDSVLVNLPDLDFCLDQSEINPSSPLPIIENVSSEIDKSLGELEKKGDNLLEDSSDTSGDDVPFLKHLDSFLTDLSKITLDIETSGSSAEPTASTAAINKPRNQGSDIKSISKSVGLQEMDNTEITEGSIELGKTENKIICGIGSSTAITSAAKISNDFKNSKGSGIESVKEIKEKPKSLKKSRSRDEIETHEHSENNDDAEPRITEAEDKSKGNKNKGKSLIAEIQEHPKDNEDAELRITETGDRNKGKSQIVVTQEHPKNNEEAEPRTAKTEDKSKSKSEIVETEERRKDNEDAEPRITETEDRSKSKSQVVETQDHSKDSEDAEPRITEIEDRNKGKSQIAETQEHFKNNEDAEPRKAKTEDISKSKSQIVETQDHPKDSEDAEPRITETEDRNKGKLQIAETQKHPKNNEDAEPKIAKTEDKSKSKSQIVETEERRKDNEDAEPRITETEDRSKSKSQVVETQDHSKDSEDAEPRITETEDNSKGNKKKGKSQIVETQDHRKEVKDADLRTTETENRSKGIKKKGKSQSGKGSELHDVVKISARELTRPANEPGEESEEDNTAKSCSRTEPKLEPLKTKNTKLEKELRFEKSSSDKHFIKPKKRKWKLSNFFLSDNDLKMSDQRDVDRNSSDDDDKPTILKRKKRTEKVKKTDAVEKTEKPESTKNLKQPIVTTKRMSGSTHKSESKKPESSSNSSNDDTLSKPSCSYQLNKNELKMKLFVCIYCKKQYCSDRIEGNRLGMFSKKISSFCEKCFISMYKKRYVSHRKKVISETKKKKKKR